MAERRDASIAALMNTVDLERKKEPTYSVDDDVDNVGEQTGDCRDDFDADGVLLVGVGRAANDEEVRNVDGSNISCQVLSSMSAPFRFRCSLLFFGEEAFHSLQ
jgi:hypothetical protein